MSTDENAPIVVDASGLRCPLPLLKTKQALTGVLQGQTVKVIATDAGSVRDFHSFVSLTDHKMIEFREGNGVYTYVIMKGPLDDTKGVPS